MPNTITTYFEFTVGGKARSSEVNTNFANHRGTLVPINADTASSSHLTHDIGSSEHRWNVGYFGTLDMTGATTTAALKFDPDTAHTLGCLDLLAGTSTLSTTKFGSFGFAGHTTTEFTKLQYQTTTGGTFDLLRGSATIATYTTDGMKHRTKAPLEYTTSSAPIGTALFLGNTSVSMAVDTSASVTICSARINAKGGGLIEFGIRNGPVSVNSDTIASTNVIFSILGYIGSTTTNMTLCGQTLYFSSAGGNTIGAGTLTPFVHNSYTAGEVVLELRILGSTDSANGANAHIRGNFFAREL